MKSETAIHFKNNNQTVTLLTIENHFDMKRIIAWEKSNFILSDNQYP